MLMLYLPYLDLLLNKWTFGYVLILVGGSGRGSVVLY